MAAIGHTPVSNAVMFCMTAFLFTMPGTALAHDPGLSALDVQVEPASLSVSLSLAASDARLASDVGGTLERFALEAVEISVDGSRLQGRVDRVEDHGTAGSVVWLTYDRSPGSRLAIRSDASERLARGHRQLLRIRSDDRRRLERMLDARANTVSYDLGLRMPASSPARQFLGLGLRHILGGSDHLLFLAALLLGVVDLRSVVKTVTAFTAAHSLTLSLAVLGLVHPPATMVEALIAASIVFVGVENLARGQVGSRWKLTFAFGLAHGFGFAGALQDLGTGSNGSSVAAPLVCFNAGVEIGQIAIAVALWPLIRAMNRRPRLRVRLVPACSVVVVAAGLFWLIDRTVSISAVLARPGDRTF